MKYRRSVGNQWLNPYIPIRRRLLHFNMDVRALWSGNSLQAIQYAMQYASKRISRLMSLAYSASSAIEIGGPLATAILMEGGAGKFSCKFERLVLVEGLHMMYC
ncbi:uncharacterized protein PITG_09775 [Phytophthora infestans T30-4]|uniref:Uncharacterized protein n=1 Tax=Phytophthora infestans (strain T30-4) TaxID=403677 RepID=D0NCS9_PHYIT|nr:uncharacterized protein PITG_09775 [Phytophthora infestans T30-4]EEY55793.1 conserved hypothetical protein [Phytophthora infestans T30-4]|eukprot:XP_002903369.1 conserved hypothetical protein [Phytophthora infestans T30-4]